MATDNGYNMELLPPRANLDTPTPPPRRSRHSGQHTRQARLQRRRAARLGSPTWVEAGTPRPVAAAEDFTSSPPKAAAVPPEENVSTNMSAYEDLPGHHLISIRNLIASSPDNSYPTPRTRGTSSYVAALLRSGTTRGFTIVRLSCRFRLRRTTASPTPTTPVRGITIPLGSASWLSWGSTTTTR